MKLHVLHDARGRILAAVSIGPNHTTSSVLRPVAGRGQKNLEVEVPSDHAAQDLATICQSLRVNVRTKTLIERKAPAHAHKSKSVKNRASRR
jgi:hypothetical protein